MCTATHQHTNMHTDTHAIYDTFSWFVSFVFPIMLVTPVKTEDFTFFNAFKGILGNFIKLKTVRRRPESLVTFNMIHMNTIWYFLHFLHKHHVLRLNCDRVSHLYCAGEAFVAFSTVTVFREHTSPSMQARLFTNRCNQGERYNKIRLYSI